MKKNKFYIVILGVLLLTLALSACGKKSAPQEPDTYTVTFNGGGTLISGEEVQIVEKGQEAVAPTYEREGYAFDDWDIDFDNVQANITVTALWKAVYTVTFNGGGGLLISGDEVQTVEKGQGAVAPTYQREGYTFDGWDKAFDNIQADITVTAKWKAATVTYTVTFNGGGGTLISGDEVQTIEKGQGAVAPTYEREGYAFDRWDKAFDNIQANITVTALWKALYTVTFNGGGGVLISGTEVQTVEKGKGAVAPTYQRQGYTFDGWDKAFDNIQANITVTALWKALYTVTFNGGGGTLISGEEVQTIISGNAAVAPTYERDGYIFDGWDNAFDNVQANITVTAQWKIAYRVIFAGNGGVLVSGDEVQIVASGGAAVAPEYEKEGYAFDRWDKAFDNVTEDLTVNAIWIYVEGKTELEALWEANSPLFFELFENNLLYDEENITFADNYEGWGFKAVLANDIPLAIECDYDDLQAALDGVNTVLDNFVSVAGTNIIANTTYSLPHILINDVAEADGVYFTADMGTLIRYSSASAEYTVPDTVHTIGEGAFEYTFIEEITLPDNLVHILDYAFNSCERLLAITIPAGVRTLGRWAFTHCGALQSADISGDNLEISEEAFSWCDDLTLLSIKEGVVSIGNNAFGYCFNLEYVYIPDSVEYIGDSAFYYCQALSVAFVPASVSQVGEQVFSQCNNDLAIYTDASARPSGWEESWNAGLTVVWSAERANLFVLWAKTRKTLNDVLGFSIYIFSMSADFEDMGIRALVTTDRMALAVEFADAAAADDGLITLNEIMHEIMSYVIIPGTNIVCAALGALPYYLGDNAVFVREAQAYLTLDNTVLLTYVGAQEHYSVPEGVESIMDFAFASDTLLSVTIPDSVTSIGTQAFYECHNLAEVFVNAQIPPAIGSEAFDTSADGFVIYVPADKPEEYIAADGWAVYADYIEAREE